jgi:glycosyltransferase involved in cell wall biosynthesis
VKISLVTPSYNQARFLAATIESILSQNVPTLEYFVLDGGSSDDSVNIIRKYEKRLTFWRSYPDEGQSAAIHEGFLRSTGDILAWVNSDDMLTPRALNYVLETFQRYPKMQFFYGGCELIDEAGKCIKSLREPLYNEKWQVYIRSCVPQSSAFWRRELYFEVGGLDSSLHYAMDYDLWFKFCSRTVPRVSKIILSKQRIYPEAKTLSCPSAIQQEMEKVRQKYFMIPSPSGRLIKKLFWRTHRIIRKTFAGCYFPFYISE